MFGMVAKSLLSWFLSHEFVKSVPVDDVEEQESSREEDSGKAVAFAHTVDALVVGPFGHFLLEPTVVDHTLPHVLQVEAKRVGLLLVK